MSEGIVFQVETSRILKLIANEIYDSPLALLRENVQNAYDAIRIRFAATNNVTSEGRIDIKLDAREIVISDNGIGMTETILRENFWKAGSSGKNSSEAISAGVVGTFGIGAMANFGVCTDLIVRTRHRDSEETLISTARRDELRVEKECISLERSGDDGPIGTTVTAILDPTISLDFDQAKAYLESYVKYLTLPVYLNDVLISQQPFSVPDEQRFGSLVGSGNGAQGLLKVSVSVYADSNSQILVRLDSLEIAGDKTEGQVVLVQSGGQIMGFRSFFGLAPIPLSSNYNLGGVANLPFLKPTAGREALQRDSIEKAQTLITLMEKISSEIIAESDVADNNVDFLNWVTNSGRYELAKRVSISIQPEGKDIFLGEVEQNKHDRQLLYYTGNDPEILATFATERTAILQIAQTNPRRKVHLQYVVGTLRIESVPTTAQIRTIYSSNELSYSEAATLLRVASVLRDDYLLADFELMLASISHGVNILVEKQERHVKIYLTRNSPILAPIVQCYDTSYDLFGQFVKDFVRSHIYARVQEFVPSSTRDGVDALRKHLERNRELYRYEEDERGDVEGYLGEYLSGSLAFNELLQASRTRVAAQAQVVHQDQIGTVEAIVPDVVNSPVTPEDDALQYLPMPPIMRLEIESDKKILTTTSQYPQLNNFTMLLGLSDRVMRTESEFFHQPHTTRILWASHRVIYIFTQSTGRLSLYYDIELREPIEAAKTSGGMFPTTTLITNSRIFIPIPEILEPEFQVSTGSKEFFVRFDILTSDSL